MSEMEETLAFPPWLDLPEPLAELVLERLPLVDYIRFAAVCPKWRSIQRDHRLRHAPHPPPMAKQLPWLAPVILYPHQELKVYSPSDRKFYTLPKPSSLHKFRCLASCCGWLLLLRLEDSFGPTPCSEQPFIFNPITVAQIPLPSLPLIPGVTLGTMSATPTDPDCIVFLVSDSCALLYRLNDHCAADWTIIQLTPLQMMAEGCAVYCRGKFYCTALRQDKLIVIDPFLQNVSQLVMRYPCRPSQLVTRYPCRSETKVDYVTLLEVGSELFLVITCRTDTLLWYQVLKADLSGQEWVRVETLGDRAIFEYGECSVLLLATDVGCKKNSIYACKEPVHDVKLGHDVFTWGAFDLGTGCWTKVDTPTDVCFGPWFLPTLDFANLARASD